MRKTLLYNYGPSQIFQDRNQSVHEERTHGKYYKELSKSVTYGVEQRDYFDQKRLKAQPIKNMQEKNIVKPMFKIQESYGEMKVIRTAQTTKEIAPVDFTWTTSQVGRTQAEMNVTLDRNYSKIRKYLEGASSIIDNSSCKTYDRYNSYNSISGERQKFKGGVDWIRRGK